MTGCVLRANGPAFSPEAFLDAFPFPRTHHQGTSLNISVGDSDGADLVGQIREATRFLAAHSEAIKSLTTQDGVDVSLDFGLWLKDTYTHSVSFPVALVALAGELRVGLDVTFYPAAAP